MATTTVPPSQSEPAKPWNPSVAELRDMVSGKTPEPNAAAAPEVKEEPKPKVEEPTKTSEPAQKASETPEATKESAETKPEIKAEPEEDHTPLPRSVQKRIDKEIAKQVSLRKEYEDLILKFKAEAGKPGTEPAKTSAPPATTDKATSLEGKPVRPRLPRFGQIDGETFEQFEKREAQYDTDLDKYEEGLAGWVKEATATQVKKDQTAEQAKAETAKVWDKAVKEHGSDFPKVVERLLPKMDEPMQVAMSQFDNWPAMAVHMDDNPETLEAAVKQYRANPTLGVAHLYELSKSLKPTPKTAKPVPEPLPDPPEKLGDAPVGTHLTYQEKLEKASIADLRKMAKTWR